MEKYYYLDNAATTKVFAEEFDLMKQNNEELFYNPSASYSKALASKKVLNDARKQINTLIRGTAGKLYFTSSATESNNTVFEGVHLRAGDVVLISKGEHPSVYNSAHRLENRGIIVKDIPLDKTGKVDEEELKNLLTEKDPNGILIGFLLSSKKFDITTLLIVLESKFILTEFASIYETLLLPSLIIFIKSP